LVAQTNARFHTIKSLDGRYKRLGNHRRHDLQKAHSFTVNLYKISFEFPLEEKFPKGYRFAYGLTNQIRRATISIESNIAEGCPKGYRFAYGRDSDKAAFLYESSHKKRAAKSLIDF
jgi:hypothetical protein